MHLLDVPAYGCLKGMTRCPLNHRYGQSARRNSFVYQDQLEALLPGIMIRRDNGMIEVSKADAMLYLELHRGKPLRLLMLAALSFALMYPDAKTVKLAFNLVSCIRRLRSN